jgi:hypothetical protein
MSLRPTFGRARFLKNRIPQHGRRASGSAAVRFLMELQMARSDYQPNAPLSPNAAHHGFDPNEPRVPGGHPDGGQWTRTAGAGAPSSPRREVTVDRTGRESWGSYVNTYRPDGTLAEQRVFNRDGSRIVSEFNTPDDPSDWDERHTVTMRDGRKVTFVTAGNVQRIYDGNGRLISASIWTDDGPQPLRPQLAFVPPAVAAGAAIIAGEGLSVGEGTAAAIAAGVALYTWLSTRNGRNGAAVLVFSATENEPGPQKHAKLLRVSWVNKEELDESCKKRKDVQALTDKAAAAARVDRTDWSPSGFGTEVHLRVAREVNGKDDDGNFRSAANPKDPNFRAEVSVLKTRAATSNPPVRYGQKGTVRVDVLENRPDNDTVCVYDIKTGEKTLAFPRMVELGRSVYYYYPRTKQIIVTEIRPNYSASQ